MIAAKDAFTGGEIAAGAFPDQHQATSITAKLRGVGSNPPCRCPRVIEGGGKAVLRREPVIDRNDHSSNPVSKRSPFQNSVSQ